MPKICIKSRAVRFQKFHLGSGFGFLAVKNLGSVPVSVLFKTKPPISKATLSAAFAILCVQCIFSLCVFIILAFVNYNVIASDMFLILLFVMR